MNINLKPANVTKIRDFAKGDNSYFQGLKLNALYNLIQSKNDTVEGLKNVNKFLEFSDGEYVAIERIGRTENFYPCSIKVHYLVKL